MNQIPIFSPLLSRFSNINHGYSTRVFGDMRKPLLRSQFAQTVGLLGDRLYKPQQVHGSIVSFTDDLSHFIVSQADGLVSKTSSLCVITADCAPLLAVDPTANIIGVAHAGWKGTMGGIATNLVLTMVKKGATVENLYVSIGPTIGLSCYNVPYGRAKLFKDAFGSERVVQMIDDAWHIDISAANKMLLMNVGLDESHIEQMPFCTSCANDTFFSYRKDGEKYGEIVSVIGINNTKSH